MSNQLKCAESLSPLVCIHRQRFPFLASPSIESAICLSACLKRLISLTQAETARDSAALWAGRKDPDGSILHGSCSSEGFFTLELLLLLELS